MISGCVSMVFFFLGFMKSEAWLRAWGRSASDSLSSPGTQMTDLGEAGSVDGLGDLANETGNQPGKWHLYVLDMD